ncbi:MAG: hypothetical protein H6748_15085 [Spirochaetaceae bacterium]|nr:hypothetical protein [Spirochaetaceae bacterium]
MSHRVIGPREGETSALQSLLMQHFTALNALGPLFEREDGQWILGDLSRLAREDPEGLAEARAAVRRILTAAGAAGRVRLHRDEERELAEIQERPGAEVISVAGRRRKGRSDG